MGPLYTHVKGKINNFIILWHYIDHQHKDSLQELEFIVNKNHSAINFSLKSEFVSLFSKRWVKELEKAGFINRGGKGSHRNLIHPKGIVITIFGKLGDDAKQYQEKEVQLKIKRSK